MLTDLQKTIDHSAPLGQKSPYPTRFDMNLLFPVKRAAQRAAMKMPDIKFFGFDVWNAYELFWLNPKGKPMRSCATFVVSSDSANICESKSVKLYLNSFNHERFSSAEEVQSIIRRDLSLISESKVDVQLVPESMMSVLNHRDISYRCLDDMDIDIEHYHRTPELLARGQGNVVNENVVSHLFKSHCLCTGQPDLGSIFIEYTGPKIDDAGLLAYLVSYRDHVGFSENCVEQIFADIMEKIGPEKLLVFGRFTRRGGIDINPYRSTHPVPFHNARLMYQ